MYQANTNRQAKLKANKAVFKKRRYDFYQNLAGVNKYFYNLCQQH